MIDRLHELLDPLTDEHAEAIIDEGTRLAAKLGVTFIESPAVLDAINDYREQRWGEDTRAIVPKPAGVLRGQLCELLDPLTDEDARALIADGSTLARQLGGFINNSAPPLRAALDAYIDVRWPSGVRISVVSAEQAVTGFRPATAPDVLDNPAIKQAFGALDGAFGVEEVWTREQ